jgi:hypothetical protein
VGLFDDDFTFGDKPWPGGELVLKQAVHCVAEVKDSLRLGQRVVLFCDAQAVVVHRASTAA